MANCPQSFYQVYEHQKTDLLMHLLTRDEEMSGVIIFVRGRDDLHALSTTIKHAGITAESVSGNKKPELRERALQELKKGITRILVATEAILREADLAGVKYVIHFDGHELDKDYLYQIETCSDEVLTLITQNDQKHLHRLKELAGSSLTSKQDEDFNYADQPSKVKRGGAKGSGPNKSGSKPLQHKKPKLKNKGPRRKTGRTRKR